jgi:hypothetical protein
MVASFFCVCFVTRSLSGACSAAANIVAARVASLMNNGVWSWYLLLQERIGII